MKVIKETFVAAKPNPENPLTIEANNIIKQIMEKLNMDNSKLKKKLINYSDNFSALKQTTIIKIKKGIQIKFIVFQFVRVNKIPADRLPIA